MTKIEAMTIGGQNLAQILNELEKRTEPGINLLDIEKWANQLIGQKGGYPSFKKVSGYSYATCLNVNDGLVHGIPTDYELKEGDALNIDIGFFYRGFHTDTAKSFIVTKNHQKYPDAENFLETGKKTLNKAIKVCMPGNHIGDISKVIQNEIESAGYFPARNYTGHAVGKQLHEKPLIPCWGLLPTEMTDLIFEGQTLAIEIIYMQNGWQTRVSQDGWSVKSQNGGLAACFEKTIAIGENKPIILTDWE